jgi:hypothetical protein
MLIKTTFYNYLKKTYPNLSETNIILLYAQAVFETGNFTSRIFKEHNNAFGIKFIGQRFANGYTIRQSDNEKFASYDSIFDSINDRMRIFYALYPDLLRSDDIDRILDTWLYSYIGRNAPKKTIASYKGAVLKIADIDLKKKQF